MSSTESSPARRGSVSTAKEHRPHPFDRWVDYLPSSPRRHEKSRIRSNNSNGGVDDVGVIKRVSLDATETWPGDEDDGTDTLMADGAIGSEHTNHHHTTVHSPTREPVPNPLAQSEEDHAMMLDWAVGDDEVGPEHVDLPSLMMLDDVQPPADAESMMMVVSDDHILLLGVTSSPLCQHGESDTETGDFGSLLLRPKEKRDVDAENDQDSVSALLADDGLPIEDLFEQRRAHLAASMQRSSESRKVLSRHIKQRASLASVLSDIERSSEQVNHYLLRRKPSDDNQSATKDSATAATEHSALSSGDANEDQVSGDGNDRADPDL